MAERALALPLKQVDQHGNGHERDRNGRKGEKGDEGEFKGDDHRRILRAREGEDPGGDRKQYRRAADAGGHSQHEALLGGERELDHECQ